MYVRLAFAVAAHLDPEILLVDEVLAVGDAAFQKKCLGKMGDVAKGGRTVLFVSHNMTAVKGLCQNAVLLSSGSISSVGRVEQVVNRYLSTNQKEVLEKTWSTIESAPGNEKVRVKSMRAVSSSGTQLNHLTVETPFDVHFEFWNLSPATTNLSMHVRQIGGETVFAAASPSVNCEPGVVEFVCHVPGGLMNDGIFAISMMIVREAAAVFTLDDGVTIEIHDAERAGNWWGKWPGAVRPILAWHNNFHGN
jgi:lipopolysaccharide transport system ATP-binding protein